jgi:hypothetical protein
MQLDAHPIGFGGRMAEAVMADRTQSAGKNVAQVAAHELNSGQSQFPAAITLGAVFPTEGYRVLSDLQHAPIGEGGARDVSAQIFERAGSTTAGLNV